MNPFVTANGKLVAAQLPCSLEEFLAERRVNQGSLKLERL
jgi:hypothetical protein